MLYLGSVLSPRPGWHQPGQRCAKTTQACIKKLFVGVASGGFAPRKEADGPADETMNKVFDNFDAAVADIPDGASIMVGGFGLCGIPETLLKALVRKNPRNLHTISNNVGVDGFGMGLMLEAGMIASHIGSYVGENKLLEEKVIAGHLDLKLIPQGTLAERIRAGGAGIPAFYTPAGVGTVVADGKEMREFDGRKYLLEHALHADFALIKAWKGDRRGNLIYRKTARNFSPMMATAAKCTIVEVEELVEAGALDPDCVVTPGIYVQRILESAGVEKRIERRTTRPALEGATS
jgi:3-oxoacid CoA-transferase subunit A